MPARLDIRQEDTQDERYFTMNTLKSAFLFLMLSLFIAGCSVNPYARETAKKSRKGDELFTAGDAEGAVRLWRECMGCGRSAELYEKIVMAYIVNNDFEPAEKWTDEGLTYFPNNVNLLFNYALVRFHRKDFPSAMENLDKVLKLNGCYPNAHFLKGLIFEEQGDKISARKEFVKEINLNPGSKGAWQKLRGLTK